MLLNVHSGSKYSNISTFFTCVITIVSTLSVTAAAVLDIDELKTSFYSVHISDKPLPTAAEDSDRLNLDLGDDVQTMQLSSKYGQKYICHYKSTPAKQLKDSEEQIADVNITDLLEPMRGLCLLKTKDWWSYEFCFGQQITQFHLEHGQKTGVTLLLGKYESDQTWLPADLEKLKKSPLNRYHTQKYVNGSVCDLTAKERKVEVRFSCVEGEIDHIGAVAELESCSYILFIYTSKICHHPYLRPPVQAKPYSIECQPVVSQLIYEDYMKSIAVATPESQQETEEAADDSVSIDQLIKDVLSGVSAKTGSDSSGVDPSQLELSDLVSTDQSEKEEVSETDKTGSGKEMTKENAQETALLEMLNMALSRTRGKNTVSKYKETIRNIVSSQFEDIIEEAKSELGEEEGEKLGESLQNVKELKDVMSRVLSTKLDELEELGEEEEKEDVGSGDQAASATLSGPSKSTKPDNSKRKLGKVKLEAVIQPQQIEVEMIDLEDISQTSEYYDAAKRASEADADKSDKQMKTVIAILRPMQEKGTRLEEKQHKQLQENYGKKWSPPGNKQPHDEL